MPGGGCGLRRGATSIIGQLSFRRAGEGGEEGDDWMNEEGVTAGERGLAGGPPMGGWSA